LLDRFGLGVQVVGPREPRIRSEIVGRRMAFDASPDAFAAAWADAEQALTDRITRARTLVGSVTIGERERLRISTVCAQLELDGVRGDLVCAHAACALAALDGEREVGARHVERAAHLALRHRLRRDPLGPPPGPGDDPQIDDALAGSERDAEPPPTPPSLSPPSSPATSPEREPAAAPASSVVPAPMPSRLPKSVLVAPRVRSRPAAASGRTSGGGIAVLDARPARDDEAVAVRATIRAALRGDDRPQTAITGGGRGGVLCLIVDTSGSMAARHRLARVKGALEAALRDAYARRDLVTVVAFSGAGARTLVAPGAPVEHAARAIRALPAGGRTPLAAGIGHAAELLESLAAGQHGARARVALLLTDGRAADPEGRARAALARVVTTADRTVVVDLEEGRVRLGLAAELAAATGADLTRLVAPGTRDLSRPGHRRAA
jgi:magnesium chelatase subunit D